MHRFTPDGRWAAPAGQFAARIHASQLPGVLSKSLLVDFGMRAVLIEDGQILGELPPGRHTLDSLAERLSLEPRRQSVVVLIREEEVPVELAETALTAQDGQPVCVGCRARVQVDDLMPFLENVLGAQQSLALDELRSLLAPVLKEQLRAVVGRMTREELVRAEAPSRVAAAMSESEEALRRYGFRLGPLVEISIRRQEPPDEPSVAPGVSQGSPPPSQPALCLTRSGRRTIRSAETAGAAASLPPHGEPPRDPEPPAEIVSPPLVNSLGMRLASLQPGRYRMGSPPDEPERSGAEDRHLVEITRPFYLGVEPVTQDEYHRVMGTDPSCFAEPETAEVVGAPRVRLPVERVSWDDACEFCRRLSEVPEEKSAGRSYRLPTEAEWEYACRAGAASAFAFGPVLLPSDANFDGRSTADTGGSPAFVGSTTPVGSFRPNAWGLYDMHGNVCEWCQDWFSPDYYRHSPSHDPCGPPSGFARVLRGGSWRSRAGQCRSAVRYSATPTHRHDAFGFRVACVLRAD